MACIDDNIPTHVMGLRDIQGILWERLNVIRESYGLTRLAQYRNYENILLPEMQPNVEGWYYYEFFYNTRSVKPTILHFQLQLLIGTWYASPCHIISDNDLILGSALRANLIKGDAP
ncbi:WD40 repeat-containing protein [Artemisia annua]|uniref:WD40 repeat-containing protein n=1 Tax=Artemisia annua TaxID=35608 RepID=A0A2U1L9X8_ARTAN|nr:WD40 repeat-containing protein [Artemisia annua]